MKWLGETPFPRRLPMAFLTLSPQREAPLTLRILVVDAHAAFRQALAYVLEQEPDFTV